MPDAAEIRRRVQAALGGFLADQRQLLVDIGPELGDISDAVDELVLDGGKRLRPLFCFWGALGAGHDISDELVRAAASLELLQACALVHDDVMDGSDTRRGRPSTHRSFSELHRSQGWRGDGSVFGTNAALLLGDLCLVWSDQLLDTCGLPQEALRRARGVHDLMRTEIMAGQYLDVLEQAAGPVGGSVERSLRVARLKSAKYTVERPLHLGAAIAGAASDVIDAYSAYGIPLGEAFQLRDDVLGVFGDPAQTGKPAGDDLREGKRTVLIAIALETATPTQQATITDHLGDPQLGAKGVQALREVITATGALARVETMIEQRLSQALAALASAPITTQASQALGELALAATRRSG